MFASQNTCGACSDGCSGSVPCMYGFGVTGQILTLPLAAGAGDAENIRDWVNGKIVFGGGICTAWPSGGSVLLCNEDGNDYGFDLTSDTTPDLTWGPTISGCSFGTIPSGASYSVLAQYTVLIESGSLAFESAGAAAYLTDTSTAWVALFGCPEDGTVAPQYLKLCKATGVPSGSCYQYVLPSPPSEFVNTTQDGSGNNPCNSATYSIMFATRTFSNLCADIGFTQGDLSAFCAANPTQCSADVTSALAGTVPDCMSPDPFFGAEP